MDRLTKRFPIYSRLIRLYPTDYQHKYGEQMLQTLADMLDDPARPKASIWTSTAFDLPVSLAKQNIIYGGRIMERDMPTYVKRNAVIGSALLAPFFAVIITNSVSNHALADSANWKHVFIVLLVFLPALAFLLNFVTFVHWAHARKRGFWKSVLDFRRNWPTLITTTLALLIVLFVPFHDSAHCVTGNRTHELANWHQTWRCVENG